MTRTRRIGGVLAVAVAMGFPLGHLPARTATAVTAPSVALPVPGGATANQFAGGRVPEPPQPV